MTTTAPQKSSKENVNSRSIQHTADVSICMHFTDSLPTENMLCCTGTNTHQNGNKVYDGTHR